MLLLLPALLGEEANRGGVGRATSKGNRSSYISLFLAPGSPAAVSELPGGVTVCPALAEPGSCRVLHRGSVIFLGACSSTTVFCCSCTGTQGKKKKLRTFYHRSVQEGIYR